jgi:transposase IS66 family protein
VEDTRWSLERPRLAEASVVGADETWWRLLGGPEHPRWWAWSVAREDAVTYTMLDSRSLASARQMLDGYHGSRWPMGTARTTRSPGGPRVHARPFAGRTSAGNSSRRSRTTRGRAPRCSNASTPARFAAERLDAADEILDIELRKDKHTAHHNVEQFFGLKHPDERRIAPAYRHRVRHEIDEGTTGGDRLDFCEETSLVR